MDPRSMDLRPKSKLVTMPVGYACPLCLVWWHRFEVTGEWNIPEPKPAGTISKAKSQQIGAWSRPHKRSKKDPCRAAVVAAEHHATQMVQALSPQVEGNHAAQEASGPGRAGRTGTGKAPDRLVILFD